MAFGGNSVAAQDTTFELMLWDEAGTNIRDQVASGMRGLADMQEGAAAISSEVRAARARFWETYPNKPGHEEAARQLSRALLEKDLYYTMVRWFEDSPLDRNRDGLPPGFFSMFAGSVDNGIPSSAAMTFKRYVDAFVQAMDDRVDGQLLNLLDPTIMLAAWEDTREEYEWYVQERNLAEFDRAGVVPPVARTLEGWLALEFARYAGDPGIDLSRYTGVLDEVKDVLGNDYATETLDALYRAPKVNDKYGPVLADLASFGITTSGRFEAYDRRPLDAFYKIVETEGTDRQWAIAQIARKGWAWRHADGIIKRMSWAYGEAVLDSVLRHRREHARRRTIGWNPWFVPGIRKMALEADTLGLIRDLYGEKHPLWDWREGDSRFQEAVQAAGGEATLLANLRMTLETEDVDEIEYDDLLNPSKESPGQETTAPSSEVSPETEVHVMVDEMPTLVDGFDSIQERLIYPDEAAENGVEGRVIVQFVVDPDGKPLDVTVVRGIGSGCDEEAIRLIRTSRFTPGKLRGEAVHLKMSLPVTFQLP